MAPSEAHTRYFPKILLVILADLKRVPQGNGLEEIRNTIEWIIVGQSFFYAFRIFMSIYIEKAVNLGKNNVSFIRTVFVLVFETFPSTLHTERHISGI